MRGGRTFVSLFCGACSIESKIKGYEHIILNDKQGYLIALLKAVQQGYIPPEEMTVDEYKYIRAHKDENPPLTGFAGFGCSFGGKWFAGYARCTQGRNYIRAAKNTLLRDMSTLMNAEILCCEYRDVLLPPNSVVYADPPYAGTTQYGNEKFDSVAFWQYMRELSEQGHTVLISEQTAPDDFACIWEKPLCRTLDVNKANNFIVMEKLFIYGQKRN